MYIPSVIGVIMLYILLCLWFKTYTIMADHVGRLTNQSFVRNLSNGFVCAYSNPQMLCLGRVLEGQKPLLHRRLQNEFT